MKHWAQTGHCSMSGEGARGSTSQQSQTLIHPWEKASRGQRGFQVKGCTWNTRKTGGESGEDHGPSLKSLCVSSSLLYWIKAALWDQSESTVWIQPLSSFLIKILRDNPKGLHLLHSRNTGTRGAALQALCCRLAMGEHPTLLLPTATGRDLSHQRHRNSCPDKPGSTDVEPPQNPKGHMGTMRAPWSTL